MPEKHDAMAAILAAGNRASGAILAFIGVPSRQI